MPGARTRGRAAILGLTGALLAGCAMQAHQPLPHTPLRAQQAVLAASPDDEASRAALQARGIDTRHWPMPLWSADALSALMRARHPALQQARLDLDAARAQQARDRQSGAAGWVNGGELTVEHHSDRGAGGSPWSLGLALELGGAQAWLGASRRSAREAQAAAAADEAALQAAQVAWRLQRDLRDAHRGLWLAQRQAESAQAVARARAEVAQAWRSRLALGAADREAVRAAEQRWTDAERLAVARRDAVAQAQRTVASAAGMSATSAATWNIDVAPFDSEARWAAVVARAAEPLALQQAALLDRLDVRQGLLRYAAADAALRLEIARQWPELVLKPGWAWDQGDRRWSLGLGISLPVAGGSPAAIAVADALRRSEAGRFAVLQHQALSELDAARAALAAAAARLDPSQRQVDHQTAQAERTGQRLAAGNADRLQVLEARLAVLEARAQHLEARADAWAAAAALEDALQRPLEAPSLALALAEPSTPFSAPGAAAVAAAAAKVIAPASTTTTFTTATTATATATATATMTKPAPMASRPRTPP